MNNYPEMKLIPLTELFIRKNVRTTYDQTKIEELALSIRKQGLLQPITVTPRETTVVGEHPLGDGGEEKAEFDILFGHRRYLAYKLLAETAPQKYAAIPCIVKRDVDRNKIIEMQLIENIQRENISAMDLKNSLIELKDRGMTHQEIGDHIGKSLGYVKNLFSAIKTINENSDLETFIEENEKITMTDIRETQTLPSKEQLRLLKLRVSGVLGSIAQLKEEVAKVKKKGDARHQEAAERGRRKLVKAIYLHENCLIALPGKYSLGEMDQEERREAAAYLRALAEKIQPQ